jgi:protein-S-isoprenylcysteine O-methyltransferase Ste14
MYDNILQLISLAGGRFIHGSLASWTDSISGIFLIIMAIAVLFEFANKSKKDELIKERNFVAISLMGIFLVAEFIIGRNGIGQFDLGIRATLVWTVIGCITVALGVILNIVARIQLGSLWSNNIVIYNDQKLFNKGLYGIVRHPLYATIFLVSIGLALQYQNYISLVLAIFIFLPMLYFRIFMEEKVLLKYLKGYDEYVKSVPVLCPFSFSPFFSVRETRINSWALRACRVTTVVLLLVALYFQISWLVILIFILMLSSTIFSISRSPIIIAYEYIFARIGVTKEEMVDVNAIRFAQGLGSLLLLCAIILLYTSHHPFVGWVLVSIVLISTAFGSLGYCLGAYIYLVTREMFHSHE